MAKKNYSANYHDYFKHFMNKKVAVLLASIKSFLSKGGGGWG